MNVWIVYEIGQGERVFGIFREESDANSVAASSRACRVACADINRWHLFDDDELRAIETASGRNDGTAADRMLIETRVELVRRGLA